MPSLLELGEEESDTSNSQSRAILGNVLLNGCGKAARSETRVGLSSFYNSFIKCSIFITQREEG